MNLSSKVSEKLGYYVYLYVDPRDESIFYVGKGSSSRCLTPLKEGGETERLNALPLSEKVGVSHASIFWFMACPMMSKAQMPRFKSKPQLSI